MFEPDARDREALRWLLERSLPGLRRETARTEDAELRHFLEWRLAELEALAARLQDDPALAPEAHGAH